MITGGCVTQSHHREKGAVPNHKTKGGSERRSDTFADSLDLICFDLCRQAANFDMRRVKMYLLRCGLSLSMEGRRTAGGGIEGAIRCSCN